MHLPTLFLLPLQLHQRTFSRRLPRQSVSHSSHHTTLSVFRSFRPSMMQLVPVWFNFFSHSKTRRVTHNSVLAVFCFFSSVKSRSSSPITPSAPSHSPLHSPLPREPNGPRRGHRTVGDLAEAARSAPHRTHHWKLNSQRSSRELRSTAPPAFQRRVGKSTRHHLPVKKFFHRTGHPLYR